MRYSKGWAILNEACTRTTMRRISEGLVDDAYWQESWHWHYGKGREVLGMAALELDVVKLMAKHTAALLEGLLGMFRGPANPQSGVARRKVDSQPQPCLK